MKIKHILIVFTLLISLNVSSQERGDLRIGAFGKVSLFDNVMINQYGVNGEWFVADNFSLLYAYGMGTNANGDITAHINTALFLLPFAASYPPAVLGVLLISEGISYHVSVNEFVEVAPYLCPLGTEINLYEEQDLILSGSEGVNLIFKQFSPINKLILSFNFGSTVIYRDMNALPSVGVSLQYQF
ncbi:MAG: hypothetical protein C0596_08335 [Marinilabiliales bacterium]|nr:MAG: hypothetical protein C0596_08335 [Marinilabiliales bacterium]